MRPPTRRRGSSPRWARGRSHTAHYGPHGEDWGTTGVNPTPFAWLGGHGVRYLPAYGTLAPLYLTRHRLYSATLNRFLSSDPLGLSGGLNLYAYAEGNPLAYIDPLGLCGSPIGDFFDTIGNGLFVLGEYAARIFDTTWNFGVQFMVSNPNFRDAGIQDVIYQQAVESWGSPLKRLGAYGQDEPIQAISSEIVNAVWDVGEGSSSYRNLGNRGTQIKVSNNRGSYLSTSSSTMSLYHGGNLRGGVVQSDEFSLTPDLSYAKGYANRSGGQVYEFKVPLEVIKKMEIDGVMYEGVDNFMGTRETAPEYRFHL